MKTRETNDGCPGFEGRNENHNLQKAAPSAFAEDLRRRATYPYRGSAEYRQAVAECVVHHAAQQAQQQPSEHSVASFEWDARVVAVILASLVGIGLILWAAYMVGTRILAVLAH